MKYSFSNIRCMYCKKALVAQQPEKEPENIAICHNHQLRVEFYKYNQDINIYMTNGDEEDKDFEFQYMDYRGASNPECFINFYSPKDERGFRYIEQQLELPLDYPFNNSPEIFNKLARRYLNLRIFS